MDIPIGLQFSAVVPGVWMADWGWYDLAVLRMQVNCPGPAQRLHLLCMNATKKNVLHTTSA